MVGITVLSKCPECGEVEVVDLGCTPYYTLPESTSGEKYFENRCPKCKAVYLTVGLSTTDGVLYADTVDEIKDVLKDNSMVLRMRGVSLEGLLSMHDDEVKAWLRKIGVRLKTKAERDAILNDTFILTDDVRSRMIHVTTVCW